MEEIEGFEVFTGYWRKHANEPEITIKKGGEFAELQSFQGTWRA